MVIRQRKTRFDPLLLRVVFPYIHSLGWVWAFRLVQLVNPTEVETEESKQAA